MNTRTKRIGSSGLAAALAVGATLLASASASEAATGALRARALPVAQVAATSAPGDTAGPPLQNIMVVQGSGEVSVTPDIARVSVGVYTQNADAGRAAEENATKTDAVIRALKAAGVAEKDIRTSNYSIYRREDTKPSTGGGGGLGGGSGNGEIVVSYGVTNSVTATVRKVSDAGRVLDAAIKAGANQTGPNGFGGGGASGITFLLDNPAPAREKALKLAVANAQGKARSLAEAAGLSSYYLMRIEETGGDYAPTRGGGENFVARAAIATPVLPGEQTVSASVTITYAIAPKLVSSPQ